MFAGTRFKVSSARRVVAEAIFRYLKGQARRCVYYLSPPL